MYTKEPNIGNLRETFFINQLDNYYKNKQTLNDDGIYASKIGDFYCEDIILEGRKSMKTIISDAIIAVDNILESPSKVAWKNEEKIDFTEYFDYWRKMKKELLILQKN